MAYLFSIFLICYSINIFSIKQLIPPNLNFFYATATKGDWVSGDPSAKSGGDTLYYEVVNPFTGKIDYPPKGRYWAFSKETFEKYVNEGKIIFKKTHAANERGFIFKRYKNELDSFRNPVNSLCFTDNLFMNQVGTKELRELLNGDFF